MELGFQIYFSDHTVFCSADRLTAEVSGGALVYRTRVEHTDVVWTHTPHRGGLLIRLAVSSAEPLNILRVDSVVADMGVPCATDHITLLGRQSTDNEIRFPHELGTQQEYCETAVGLYPALDDRGVILAGVAPFLNVCSAAADKQPDGRFVFRVKTEYTKGMLEQKQLAAERAYVNFDTTLDDLFTVYRDLLPQSRFPMPKLTGWNSWDYYLDKVTAEDIFENIDALSRLPFAHQLDYIVIDDGWQKNWGEWTENEKFACGLKAVADRIREKGFVPGLWMAPVGVREDAAILEEHPDWLCRDAEGELLKELRLYYIDPTHPRARAFILDNYRYQYKAGFRLFKMDYIAPLLQAKSFHDPAATPYGVIAGLIEEVKACTGPDAVVLGCSVPLECGADIVPSMRLGLDIHNHFSHVKAISRSIAWAWMYNNKTTRIDPDFMLVRGEQTATELPEWSTSSRNDYPAPPRCSQTAEDRMKLIWRHGDQFNALEAETWANLVAVCGGNLFLSDCMSELNELGNGILERAFALAGDEVRPVYLRDDHRQPSLWLGDRALLLVNWEEIPRTITVEGIGGELVSTKPFEHKGAALRVTLLPHESFAARYV